ncbi:hypothetical protein BJY24_000206 [Nocardia transvalensis]|uniref:Uncharacterized protein n=1 Tax=Nocardia transvalensis TaxID=37333 RepID=A0A7W9P8Y6_9NOCA|nr:hypothetical protein [Nocardia transvalensis]MBB5911339.1 hypothetical protein [Nocardia transvalensis]
MSGSTRPVFATRRKDQAMIPHFIDQLMGTISDFLGKLLLP